MKSIKNQSATKSLYLLLLVCFLVLPINGDAKSFSINSNVSAFDDDLDDEDDLFEDAFEFDDDDSEFESIEDDESDAPSGDISEDEIHQDTNHNLKHSARQNKSIDKHGYPIKTAQIIAMGIDNSTLDILHGLGYTVLHERWLTGLRLNIVTLSIPTNLTPSQALAALRKKDPNTLYDLNHIYHLDSSKTQLASTNNINSTATNSGKAIGLIDTAIERTHPVFQKASLFHKDFVTDKQPRPTAHGTAIASQLVTQMRQLYSASVFYQDAQQRNHASVDSLTAAIDWLIEKRVAIINMSLSGPPNQLLHFIIRQASQRGHLIIAAAGNQGPASPPLYPAAYPEVVAVTAVDKKHRVYRRANRGEHVEVAAIGVTLRTADSTGGYTTNSGTSFAAPTVSAWFANTLQRPDLQQAQQLRRELHLSAKDLGATGRDPIFGHGLISNQALEAAP